MQFRKKITWSVFVFVFLSLFLQSCAENKTDDSSDGEQQKVTEIVANETTFVEDAAGNKYPTVQIGEQVWLAEDLHTTVFDCADSVKVKFTNGLERGPGVKFYDATPRYAYYNNNKDTYTGIIYSYGAITSCQLCPEGYRIPTKADWETLVSTLGGKMEAGKKLLKGGSSGFNAEMSGRIDDYGSVLGDEYCFWWSTDLDASSKRKAAFTFESDYRGILRLIPQDARVGNYVRCVKE
ncbi:MAG: FISUMP domain-containing protein [Bacteroidota bacterium]